jgi:ribosomal protein S18 acetylase RimI-like enzyme
MPTRGVIRRLWAGERDLVRDHLLRLDPEDRQLRFGGHASNAHVAGYCEGLDWSRGLVLGYVVAGQVRGLGELKLIENVPARAAELPASVERPFQNRGIGTALLTRLVTAARNP